ncbi:hypothetical protein CK203_051433 [Vitis vinifera]|uniref:Disease resistance protein At4g27190-like leucine-rich repeats domain-containing protein n=1 Tax=Vitis vinifera TaxID=29760 RepID=A0A438H1U0_VITVI|nr:hypothetical protein CK203_051433 [Vitis vinifera]
MSKQVWTTLQTHFSSQSCSCISHLKRQLQTLTQSTKSCSKYLENAKNLADQLAAAGKPIDDQDLISFLLGGLQSSYTPFVTSFNFVSHDTDFTFEEFQAELLGYENLLDVNQSVPGMDSNHFAFSANKSKAPTYVKEKRPPLPPTKMQNAGRFPPQDLVAMVVETNATFDHQVWCLDLATKRVCISRHVIYDEKSFPAKELAENTTSRRTNPTAAVPSQNDHSSSLVEMPILVASNSTQQSPPPTSNDYSPPPPPTLNFENSIDPEIVIPPISHSPQLCISSTKNSTLAGYEASSSLLKGHCKPWTVLHTISSTITYLLQLGLAEYRSMALAIAEVYWLRMLFKELAIGLVHIPTLCCDNIGAIALSSNPIAIASKAPHRFVMKEAVGLQEEWQWMDEYKNCTRISLKCKNIDELPRGLIVVSDPSLLPEDDMLFDNLSLTRYTIVIGNRMVCDGYKASRRLILDGSKSFHPENCLSKLLKRSQVLDLHGLKDTKHVVYELDKDGFLELKYLTIHDCHTIQYILHSTSEEWVPPPSSFSFPMLEQLVVTYLSNLEAVCHGPIPMGSFDNLRILKLYNCERFRYIFSLPTKDERESTFPQLQYLELEYLSKLISFYSTRSIGSQESMTFFNQQVS